MKKLFVAMAAVLASMSMSAQQNISFREGKLVSPQVNSDKTVTFRLKAPKAKSVKVLADWEQNNGQGTLKKGKDGVWEYTTPQLASEMFTYRFDVDGVVSIDPVNPFTRRDVGDVFSIFYVGGALPTNIRSRMWLTVRFAPCGITQTQLMPIAA